jgi:iron complex outermembrane recepter protein
MLQSIQKQKRKMSVIKKSLCIGVICILLNNAFAQKTDSIKTREIGNVTITALTNSAKAPFTKTVYNATNLQTNNAAVDLPILLQNASNVVANSDAGTGTGYTGLRLRGSDLTRINVTLNGVPVNDAESQNTYFTDIPDLASSAQGITIQRGVGSSTNGAAAFGGSININTIQLPKKFGITFSNTYGTFNTWRNTVKINSGIIGNKVNMALRLSRITSNGYITNSKSKLRGGQFTFGYAINPKSEIIFNYINGYEKTGQAWSGVPQDSLKTNRTYNELGIKEDGTYYANQTDNYGQNYFQLIFNKKVNSDWKLNVTPYVTLGKGYYEEYKQAQNFSSYGLPDIINGIDTITSASMVRQLWLNNKNIGTIASAIYTQPKYTLSIGSNASMYLGKHYGEVIAASLPLPSNYRWYDLTSNKKEVSTFAKMEYNLNRKLFLFGDVQARAVNYIINGFRNAPTLKQHPKYIFFNPKVGASYAINAKEFAYASLAIANKEPNRDDLENNVLPKAERLINTEIGYSRNIKNGIYKINFYHMLYKNQLVLTGKINDVGAYTRTNVSNSYRAGVELEGVQNITAYLLLQGNIALSENKIRNYVNYIDDYDAGVQQMQTYNKTDIAFSPKMVSALSANIRPLYWYKHNWKFNLLLQHKYVSKQFLDNTSDMNKVIPAFSFTDATFSYSAKPSEKTNAVIKFGVNNVWNNLYQNNGYTYSYVAGGLQTFNYYFPQAGRRYWLGVDISL